MVMFHVNFQGCRDFIANLRNFSLRDGTELFSSAVTNIPWCNLLYMGDDSILPKLNSEGIFGYRVLSQANPQLFLSDILGLCIVSHGFFWIPKP